MYNIWNCYAIEVILYLHNVVIKWGSRSVPDWRPRRDFPNDMNTKSGYPFPVVGKPFWLHRWFFNGRMSPLLTFRDLTKIWKDPFFILCQAITGANVALFSIRSLGSNFNEIYTYQVSTMAIYFRLCVMHCKVMHILWRKYYGKHFKLLHDWTNCVTGSSFHLVKSLSHVGDEAKF